MIDLYKYLCSENNKDSLAKYINDNVPELIECDVNNHVHDRFTIKEFNSDGNPTNSSWFDGNGVDRGYSPHHFSFVLEDSSGKSNSYQTLWWIYDNTDFNDIENVAKIGCWGFKLREEDPWVYPNLGLKVKNVILRHIRKNKIKRLL